MEFLSFFSRNDEKHLTKRAAAEAIVAQEPHRHEVGFAFPFLSVSLILKLCEKTS